MSFQPSHSENPTIPTARKTLVLLILKGKSKVFYSASQLPAGLSLQEEARHSGTCPWARQPLACRRRLPPFSSGLRQPYSSLRS